jgi:hypothetical protein
MFLLLTMAGWCDDLPAGAKVFIQWQATATPAQVEGTIDMIKSRLDDLSTYHLDLRGKNQAVLTLGNAANKSGLLARLTRRGVLTIKSLDRSHFLRLRPQDLVGVRAGLEEDPPTLFVRLSPDADQRLAALAVDPRLVLCLDGDQVGTIRKPRRGPQGWGLMGPDLDDGKVAALSLLVSHGPLPLAPQIVKIIQP